MARDSFRIPEAASVRERIARYDKPGPRYTSYPTAPVWTGDFGETDYREALATSRAEEVSVYVHIPFCESLCHYCACNRKITRDHSVVTPYLDAMEREVEMAADALGRERPSVQLAVGGGTPTFLSPDELLRMCDILDPRFPPAPDAERSLEADPRVTTRAQLEALASRGFNRISFGVQDFSAQVQQAVHRTQSVEQTERLTEEARELGFGGVNFDLIYGLPFQTVDSFDKTLDEVIRLRPDRIALYSYAHVTWISKAQRGFEKKDLPSAERKLSIFLHAITRFDEAGYRFLGLDHFALPEDELTLAAASGDLRRNFMGYTTRAGVDSLAFGASGISELAHAYAQSLRDPEDWSERLMGGQLPTMRGWWLTDDDVRRKWLIQRVMCQGEVGTTAYREEFGEPLEARVPNLHEQLRPLAEDGLLVRESDDYRLTPLGRLFLRPIAMTFDAYLPAQDPSRPMFSRTV